jgi:hypothetical protein
VRKGKLQQAMMMRRYLTEDGQIVEEMELANGATG